MKITDLADLADLPRPYQLQNADLREAYLREAYLQGAYLSRANLQGANLWCASLQGADLEGAKLRGASLQGADLEGAKLPEFLVKLPPVGESFIAWKKVRGNVILKLEIPAESPRVSTFLGTKCRAKRAKVLEAFDLFGNPVQETEFESLYDHTFTYRLGEVGEFTDFDDDIRVECTQGIHFFSMRGEAERYAY